MRPLPATPPAADTGEPALVELIRAEIASRGPITFARFMERALYEPGLGYYATSALRPTRQGDFLTAPELHPIFAKAVMRQLEEMLERLGRPSDFAVREYGAGRGTLGSAISERFPYEAVEAADARPASRVTGVIVANEFLDALPVHRVAVSGGRLREVFVGWSDGRFVEVVGELSDPRLSDWFNERGIQLGDEQRAEVNLAMLDWLGEVAATLERGYVVIFDYGAPAAELYGTARRSGTLRTFRSHHVGGDVLGGVGRQDLTAHVDFDALELGAQGVGLSVLGRTTQAKFLLGCGLEELLADERERAGDDLQAQMLLRSSVGRLLDPRQLGGYGVVILGRGVSEEIDLSGLTFGLGAGSA